MQAKTPFKNVKCATVYINGGRKLMDRSATWRKLRCLLVVPHLLNVSVSFNQCWTASHYWGSQNHFVFQQSMHPRFHYARPTQSSWQLPMPPVSPSIHVAACRRWHWSNCLCQNSTMHARYVARRMDGRPYHTVDVRVACHSHQKSKTLFSTTATSTTATTTTTTTVDQEMVGRTSWFNHIWFWSSVQHHKYDGNVGEHLAPYWTDTSGQRQSCNWWNSKILYVLW